MRYLAELRKRDGRCRWMYLDGPWQDLCTPAPMVRETVTFQDFMDLNYRHQRYEIERYHLMSMSSKPCGRTVLHYQE